MNGRTHDTSDKWKLLTQILWSFMKIGPVCFGGGYAMIPLIRKEAVEKRGWVEEDDIADLLALSQSAPGAIAINAAILVGYRKAGFLGAAAACLGVTLPGFFIVIALSVAMVHLQSYPKIKAAFEGIRIAVVAIIVYAGVHIGKTAIFDKVTLAAAAGSVAILIFAHVHPAALIAFGLAAGIAATFFRKKQGLKIQYEKRKKAGYKYKDYYIGDGI